jgi:ornithine carbamoyltransferase
MKHFISIADTSAEELRHTARRRQAPQEAAQETGRNDPILAGKTLAMIFEKPSLRTRVSFAVAMTQLGGNGLLLREEEVGLGKREPVQDVARVLSGMCDGIMARTFEHEKVHRAGEVRDVPVINGLTDYSHPCQAMADLMTIEEHFGHDSKAARWRSSATATTSRGRWRSRAGDSACASSSPRRRATSCRARTWTGSCRRCRRWISWSRDPAKPCARPT